MRFPLLDRVREAAGRRAAPGVRADSVDLRRRNLLAPAGAAAAIAVAFGTRPTLAQSLAVRAKAAGQDLGSSLVTANGGAATLTQRFSHSVNAVDDKGCDPTGATDSTASMQVAFTAAAGGAVVIPPGNYLINATILQPSNTAVLGTGFGTRWFTTVGNGNGFNFINNAGFNAAYGGTLAQNLRVCGIFFDYGALTDGGTHAVSFRLAQNCIVEHCWFNGGNNGTAMLATRNTMVRDCVATNNGNVAYDHWDGIENATVEDCVASLAPGSSTGVMFTAASTSGGARTTRRCTARNVAVYGGGLPVMVNVLSAGSFNYDCLIEGIFASGCNGGIVITGPGGRHRVRDINLENCGSSAAGDCVVRIGGEPGAAPPNDCEIDAVTANGHTTQGADVGLVQLGGLRHKVGSLTLSGSAVPGGVVFWVPTAASGTLIAGPVTADAATISGVTYGLFSGSTASSNDTNAALDTFDPWLGAIRHQGSTHNFSGSVSFATPPKLGAYTPGAPGAPTGTLTVLDSTGTARRIPVL
ncbi:MAG: hypothetical protein JO264_10330 [Acidisphaera sp.]|nr:hypothetical protein [Acidisphaera sp.]